MVLQEGLDDAPPDDHDAYSRDIPSIVQYKLNPDSYARPLPILGALFGYTTARQLNRAGDAIEQATLTIGRPPSQEQADAIAEHIFRAVSIASYGPPIGVGIGLYRAYISAPTFRWPFYQPKNITYSPRSATMMHIGRNLAYSLNGWFWGAILVGGYASSLFRGRFLTDPRLKDIVGAMKSDRLRAAEDKGKGRATESPQTPRPLPANVDDASPTGGWNKEGETGVEFGETSSKPPAFVVAQRSWPKIRPVPEPQSQDNSDQPFDAFEPSPARTEQAVVEDKAAPEQSDSVWERIRRGEKAMPVTRDSHESAFTEQRRQDKQGQGSGLRSSDSYSYSIAEEERSYAKDEAQKEFDARVERERRGGDFSIGNGDQKRC